MKNDSISRQRAIDALMQEFKRIPTTAIRAKNVIEGLSSVQPEITEEDIREWCYKRCLTIIDNALYLEMRSRWSASAQPERLTDDDFETIRIHLNAYKEKLCNQRRWKEAEEYQRIIDRFMAFASAQQEQPEPEELDFVQTHEKIGVKLKVGQGEPMRPIDANHLKRWILLRVFKTQLSVADVVDQIDREDTIEPKRKIGRWKLLKNGDAKCLECGFTQVSAWDMDGWDNFCHHCGSYNGGEQDD